MEDNKDLLAKFTLFASSHLRTGRKFITIKDYLLTFDAKNLANFKYLVKIKTTYSLSKY